MEKPPLNSGEKKIEEYADRIKNGESKDTIFQDLPESFKSAIENKLVESDEIKIAKIRERLDISEGNPPINYIETIIDDEFMQKNLMPNGGLRMTGGQANWNGEVDLMQYVISEELSPEYREIAADKIEKIHAGQEKTYQHESHHIRNRENELTPHVAADNLREFLSFRVLDELSAFTTGELYNQNITAETILQSLQTAKQRIADSYYGEPFSADANWYLSQHSNKPEVYSREINQDKYHQIMRQYFKINGHDTLAVLQKENKLQEFTNIVNSLIIKLDDLLNTTKSDSK